MRSRTSSSQYLNVKEIAAATTEALPHGMFEIASLTFARVRTATHLPLGWGNDELAVNKTSTDKCPGDSGFGS